MRSLRQHQHIKAIVAPSFEYSHLRGGLDDLLLGHPSATWFGIARGDSMQDEGIFNGDVIIVDRKTLAQQGSVIVGQFNGEFVCKIFDKKRRLLLSSNERYPAIPIRDFDTFSVEGVVTSSVRFHFKSSLLSTWPCTH
ncbi:S24 family peptidase [Shewanella acanthi]|nr:S24 family peptidase [Shewanella acanthi]QYJ80600.1 S24 family peptidase [Shewanella acanthi]